MQQRVDPFIPVHGQHTKRRPAPQPAPKKMKGISNDIVVPMRQKSKQALDKLRPWYNTARPRMTPQRASHVAASHGANVLNAPNAKVVKSNAAPELENANDLTAKQHRWLYPLQLVAASIAILTMGVLLQVAYVGEALIGLYAIWAFVRHVSSRTTFMLALVAFGGIIVMLFLRPDSVLMRNFATYAFMFLLIAVISLLREARE